LPGRREAIRQLADARRRLAAAEATLEDAHAARKHAEEAYDAASDRFDAAEHAPRCGHLEVVCTEPGCTSMWYRPPHDPEG
jgi:hypothetical protein